MTKQVKSMGGIALAVAKGKMAFEPEMVEAAAVTTAVTNPVSAQGSGPCAG